MRREKPWLRKTPPTLDLRSKSGMLLYAKTDAMIQPDNIYKMSGNQVNVRTLDLNQELSEIAKQPSGIVAEYLG